MPDGTVRSGGGKVGGQAVLCLQVASENHVVSVAWESLPLHDVFTLTHQRWLSSRRCPPEAGTGPSCPTAFVGFSLLCSFCCGFLWPWFLGGGCSSCLDVNSSHFRQQHPTRPSVCSRTESRHVPFGFRGEKSEAHLRSERKSKASHQVC